MDFTDYLTEIRDVLNLLPDELKNDMLNEFKRVESFDEFIVLLAGWAATGEVYRDSTLFNTLCEKLDIFEKELLNVF